MEQIFGNFTFRNNNFKLYLRKENGIASLPFLRARPILHFLAKFSFASLTPLKRSLFFQTKGKYNLQALMKRENRTLTFDKYFFKQWQSSGFCFNLNRKFHQSPGLTRTSFNYLILNRITTKGHSNKQFEKGCCNFSGNKCF